MNVVPLGSWECKQAPESLLDWVQSTLVVAGGVVGATRPTPETLEFTSQDTPAWAIFLAIILFPIGLLALMAKDRGVLILRATAHEEGGCTLEVSGRASGKLRKGLVWVHSQTALPEPVVTP